MFSLSRDILSSCPLRVCSFFTESGERAVSIVNSRVRKDEEKKKPKKLKVAESKDSSSGQTETVKGFCFSSPFYWNLGARTAGQYEESL